MRFALSLAAAALLISFPVYAMGSVGQHGGMHHAPAKLSAKLAKNPSVKANIAAMKKMHEGMDITYTGDADVDFVRGMVPHHQGAVDMVAVLHKYGKDAELAALGKRIAAAQNLEIVMMKRWLEIHDNPKLAQAECEDPVAVAFRKTMADMHKAMNITYTGDADVDFARGMIPHHQGAIDMAWVLKANGKDPVLREFADDIIRSQGQEIAFMEEWLQKKGKQ